MIFAARMEPMPKISIRVMPEAPTSASMRPFKSSIFRSSVRTSRSTSDASCRRRRAEAPPLGRMPCRMRAARGAESDPATPPGRRSRRSPWRRLSALVRSATKSSRLSESRRSTSEPTSGPTAARSTLREAAKAVGPEGIDPVVLAGVAAREHSNPRRKLGRHVHHGFTSRYQPPRQVPTETAGVLYGPTALGGPFRPAFEGSQASAVLGEAGVIEELACGFVDRGDGDRRLVGIDPYEHLHARVPPFRSNLRHRRARRTFRLRAF